jgi:hypothetical protein
LADFTLVPLAAAGNVGGVEDADADADADGDGEGDFETDTDAVGSGAGFGLEVHAANPASVTPASRAAARRCVRTVAT